MKASTVKKVLKNKIKAWTDTIEDEVLRKAVLRDTVVTGGSIASMLLREPVNDYDIYFKTYETTLAVAKYYVGQFKVKNKKGIEVPISVQEHQTLGDDILADSEKRIKIIIKSGGITSEEGTNTEYQYFEQYDDGEQADKYVDEIIKGAGAVQDKYDEIKDMEIVEGDAYRPVFMSSNAITLSDDIQIIIRFHGEPEVIHENFDYVHCTNYWESDANALTLKPAALEALLARELVYAGSLYPICSLIRMRKFINRGWTINAGQILKMVMQVGDLDLSDWRVLEDQLVGVDAAYFAELIECVKKQHPDEVNKAYLISVVDRIF